MLITDELVGHQAWLFHRSVNRVTQAVTFTHKDNLWNSIPFVLHVFIRGNNNPIVWICLPIFCEDVSHSNWCNIKWKYLTRSSVKMSEWVWASLIQKATYSHSFIHACCSFSSSCYAFIGTILYPEELHGHKNLPAHTYCKLAQMRISPCLQFVIYLHKLGLPGSCLSHATQLWKKESTFTCCFEVKYFPLLC